MRGDFKQINKGWGNGNVCIRNIFTGHITHCDHPPPPTYPPYNHNGWLGVKHQVSLSHTHTHRHTMYEHSHMWQSGPAYTHRHNVWTLPYVTVDQLIHIDTMYEHSHMWQSGQLIHIDTMYEHSHMWQWTAYTHRHNVWTLPYVTEWTSLYMLSSTTRTSGNCGRCLNKRCCCHTARQPLSVASASTNRQQLKTWRKKV